MCGIVGAVSTQADALGFPALRDACTTMRHRGPDGEGIWNDRHCGLGHRRLSIIDLANGGQPMSYADGRYWITFNGEIYNYRELKSTLAGLGHRFRTDSDTEVILASCAEWWTDAPRRFRGIFAFGLWDRDERTLLLARDHLGVKPLLYSARPDALIFSSELKSLLTAGAQPRIEPTAISDYLALGYTLGTKTVIANVQRLEPGTTLTWRDGHIVIQEFWDAAPFAESVHSSKSDVEYTNEYGERLAASVKAQMVSDVPVGAFLSGGIDSSTIAYSMRQHTPQRLRTFSMGFQEPSYSELPIANQVAEEFGTEHWTEVVTEDVSSVLPKIVRALDEPLGDTSIVPTYFVSRLAARHLKVVLSGDGADETLAGYDTYVADALQTRYSRLPGFVHRSVVRPVAQLIPDSRRKVSLNYKVKQFIEHAHGDWRRAHYGWRLLFDEAMRAALLGAAAQGHDPFEEYSRYFERVRRADRLNQALYVDIKTWLANDILTKVDRATMSVGLEARVPFLDPQLVEYSLQLPMHLKMRGAKRKVILRRAMKGKLPAVVLTRRKSGFNAPISAWARQSLRPMVDDLLTIPSTILDVDHPRVQRMWREHKSGEADHGFRLWALISLLLWEREVLHQAARSAVPLAARG